MRLARSVIVASLTVATAGAGLAIAAAPASAAAATRYVAKTGDDGNANNCLTRTTPCKTISYAVKQATAGDTVSIASGTYAETVGLTEGLTLVGDASGRTVITGADGGPASVFAFGILATEDNPLVVTLRDLDISGNTSGSGVLALVATVRLVDSHVDRNDVGGIAAIQASVTVTGGSVSGNRGDSGDGSPAAGAGIASQQSTVAVTGTTIAGNAGAGIAQGYESFGGDDDRVVAAADIPASSVITRSTVSGNGFAGIVSIDGGYTVDNSTVSGNSRGGVVIADPGAGAAVTSSTIVGTTSQPNFPQQGGFVNVADQSTARRARSAFAVRSASLPKRIVASVARKAEQVPAGTVRSAGVRIAAAAPKLAAGQISVTGSVVATQGKGVPDCLGTVTDAGYNASSDAANSCKFSAAKKDLVKTAPKLGALAANGGPTRTHLPLAGSPLRDRIPGTQAADQRGVARPQGPRSDIGAVEAAAAPVRITTKSLPDGQVGDRYRKALAATGGDGSYAWSLAKGSSLPDGLSLSRSGVISGTPTEKGRFSVTVVADGAPKRFTLVIDASGAGPNGDSQDPIAETGAPSASLLAWGSALLLSGFAVMVSAGHVGRRPGRHRPVR